MAKKFNTTVSLKLDEKFITICEKSKCDSTFVFSCLLDKLIDENETVLMILTQNTPSHFYNIGKILGYDLNLLIKKHKLHIVDVLNSINALETNIKNFHKNIFYMIHNTIDGLLKNNRRLTVVFEDISHFLDLGMEFQQLFQRLSVFKRITVDKHVRFFISCHSDVPDDEDDKLYNSLCYLSDVVVNVSGLKTGVSRNVSGAIEFVRPESWNRETKKDFYHYKLSERSVDIFKPGRDL